jgi:hypothetical protein
MSTQATLEREYERTLLGIARRLPPGRVEQLIEYARFLEAQILDEALLAEVGVAETAADDARWDALLASEDGQALLEKLAAEASVEHGAGKSTDRRYHDLVLDRYAR